MDFFKEVIQLSDLKDHWVNLPWGIITRTLRSNVVKVISIAGFRLVDGISGAAGKGLSHVREFL